MKKVLLILVLITLLTKDAGTFTPETNQEYYVIGRFILIRHSDKTFIATTKDKISRKYKTAYKAISEIQ